MTYVAIMMQPVLDDSFVKKSEWKEMFAVNLEIPKNVNLSYILSSDLYDVPTAVKRAGIMSRVK